MTVLTRSWPLVLIAIFAVIGDFYQWSFEIQATVLGVILVIGLVTIWVGAREKELERASQRLKELAGYFSRRFMGESTISIFAIIERLFKTDNTRLWEWARACDMSFRVFNVWCNRFINRMEMDTKTGRFSLYLRNYTNELWSINNLYYEYIEQFYEVAGSVEVPPEILEQYGKFLVEYNTFVGQLREMINQLKTIVRTEIEPPSIKLANELPAVCIKRSLQKSKK
jgi:ABC-type multidrug transport system fused ATPase/permease subunit